MGENCEAGEETPLTLVVVSDCALCSSSAYFCASAYSALVVFYRNEKASWRYLTNKSNATQSITSNERKNANDRSSNT